MDENQSIQQTETVAQISEKENGTKAKKMKYPADCLQEGWYKAIFYTLGLIVLAFAIQLVLGIGAAAVLMVQLVMENGGNIANFQEEYMSLMEESGIINTASALASFVTALVFGIWYKLKYAKKYTIECLKNTMHRVFTLKKVTAFIMAAVTCYVIAVNAMLLMEHVMPDQVNSYLKMAESVFSKGILTFIMTVFFAPIGEECLVRGLIQRKAERYFPMIAVIIIETVSFGILHGNIVQGLYVVPLALVTGYLSYHYRSVIPSILFHMVYNFMPNIISLIPDEMTDRDWVWQVTGGALIIGTVLIWKAIPKEEKEYVAEG